ncbi:MAG: hypothetical protein ACHQ3P_04290 [Candidatus Limnocylindrales bacterium]
MPRQPQSYSEKYAGTIYGSPVGAPAPPPPSSEPQPSSRFGLLGITLILAGLWWLIPGIVGLITDLALAGGGIGGIQVAGAALGISIVAQIVSILIGVKILLAPGRFSLGCTGISALLAAVGLLAALSQVPDPTTTALAILGVGAGLCLVFALAVLTASQVV